MRVSIETITAMQILALRDAQTLETSESYILVGLCNEAMVQLTKDLPLARWFTRADARTKIVDAYNKWISEGLN